MYHYHCAPQFPLGTAAVRKMPCACSTCNALIKTELDHKITYFKDQPRFQRNENCYMEPIMRMNNDQYIVKLKTDTKKSDETYLLELKERQLTNITASIASEIEIGKYGAVATSDEKCDEGYGIAEWKSTPYYDDGTEQLICNVTWIYSLDYAPRWYHEHADGPTFDTVLVRNVVLADVVANIISPDNMPPATTDLGTAIKLAAMRVSDESHSFIFDEIYPRLFIEYDPNQIIDVVEVVNEVEAVSSDESSNGEYLRDSDDDDDA